MAATLVGLLETIESYLKEQTSQMFLSVKAEGWDDQPSRRAPLIYKMRMPDPNDAIEQVPYILIQMTGGSDERSRQSNTVRSEVDIRLIITLYDESPEQGSFAIMHIIETLRDNMLSKRIFDGYEMTEPFVFNIITDNTMPYHLAEIYTTWKIPSIEMNTNEYKGKAPWEAFLHGE